MKKGSFCFETIEGPNLRGSELFSKCKVELLIKYKKE